MESTCGRHSEFRLFSDRYLLILCRLLATGLAPVGEQTNQQNFLVMTRCIPGDLRNGSEQQWGVYRGTYLY